MKLNVTTLGLLLAVVFGMGIMQACQNETGNNSTNAAKEQTAAPKLNNRAIAPPLEGVDVPFEQLTVNAQQGGTLVLDNGTQIEIPKNAFVDANGQPVKGDVRINYREFHNAAQIIASGIPMTNKAGDKYMQTAGMFQVEGSANGQPVQIADNQALNVKMASFVDDGQAYDFFYYDQDAGDWDNLGTNEPQANTIKAKKVAALSKLPEQPIKPEAPDEEAFKFNFDINYKRFPELRAYEDVIWQYAGNTDSDDPQQNDWIFEEDWASITLEKASAGKYNIVLGSANKQFKTLVQPVLEGDDLQKALADFDQRQKRYNEIKQEKEQEQERLNQEADLLRSFQVQQFGVYNWDVWKDPQRMLVRASFDFGDAVNKDINNITVFLVTAERRSVVRYDAAYYDRFSFDPNEKNEIIAVLPGNKMAICSTKDFAKIDFDDLKARGALEGKKPKFTFKMQIKDRTIKSVNDLEGMFASL